MKSIPARWLLLAVLSIEAVLAAHVFAHFALADDAAPELLGYVGLLIPALLFAAAVAVLRERPGDFAFRAVLIGFGAVLLAIFALSLVDLFGGGALTLAGRLRINLAVVCLAPIPLLVGFRGPHPGTAFTLAVALVYLGFSSVAYRLQYGPEVSLLQAGFVPLWACWAGLLGWDLGARLIRTLGLDRPFRRVIPGNARATQR